MTGAARSDADGVLPVAIGTLAWAGGLIALLLVRGQLEESDSSWWIGVAVIGLVSGLVGLVFLTWRRRRRS